MTPAKLLGCGTALVTPFRADGSVDEAALRAFVDWQIGEGVHFLVPCGSTGEAATLTPDEHRRVVEIVVEQARGRVPICAGAGANDTKKAIVLSAANVPFAGLAVTNLHVSNAWGGAVQFGFDYMLDRHWGLNVDVKKLWLQPNYSATVNGTIPVIGTAHIDPWLVGGGVTYKF